MARPPLRRRRSPLWPRLLLGVVLLILAIPAVLYGAIRWTLPASEAELRIAGLAAPVEITLDAQGIPRIRAGSERDAAMALGFLHARDRMFQMEMMRRSAEGRLSELAGRATLRMDRFHRLLGLKQRAEADFAALDADSRGILEAYAAGVNAWIGAQGMFAAPEFLALGAPEPWQPYQSLLWAKVMGLWLSGNWRTEVERLRVADDLPAERLWDLWPADASAGRPDVAAIPGLDRMLAQIPVFGTDAPLPASASNAWVVAGRRSASGAPLLAADPHLAYGAPILWYLARIELPEGRIRAGATSPGVPLVVIGRNQDLAWGFTTTHSDTQDVFLEPEAAARIVRRETIPVRDQEPELLVVRETANGPVVSDLEVTPREDGRILSLRMANLEPNDTAAAGLLALNRARSLAEARAAAALISSPPQNLMVAERAGGIAMYLVGRTPIRAEGDGSLPGEKPWTGFIPFDAMPHVENPASGILVNANNRVSPEGHTAFLGRDWHADWRFRRIHARLAGSERHRPEDFVALQMDTLSLFARETLPFLRAIPPGTGSVAAAQALLRNWDGDMAADRPEPLIWAAFARRMTVLALREARVPELRGSSEFLAFLLRAPEPMPGADPAEAARGSAAGAHWWCGGDCRAMAATALAQAVLELEERHGGNLAAWRWGEAHQARFEHPLLRGLPVLGRATSLAVPVGGDGETIQRQTPRGYGPTPFTAIHGAGLRLVADLADPDATLAVIATGQSAHPLSPHWRDLLGNWSRGAMLRLTREPGEVAGRIRLAPQ